MGLIGEITGGILLGQGITNVVVRYSKSQYQAKIDKLQECANELAGHLSNLEGYKSQLKTIWDDDDAAKYHRNLDEEIKTVKNAQQQVQAQIDLWNRAIDEMVDTVSEQQEKIDVIKSAIDSLDIKD